MVAGQVADRRELDVLLTDRRHAAHRRGHRRRDLGAAVDDQGRRDTVTGQPTDVTLPTLTPRKETLAFWYSPPVLGRLRVTL